MVKTVNFESPQGSIGIIPLFQVFWRWLFTTGRRLGSWNTGFLEDMFAKFAGNSPF